MVTSSLPRDVPGSIEVLCVHLIVMNDFDDINRKESQIGVSVIQFIPQVWKKFVRYVKEALKYLKPFKIFAKLHDEEIFELIVSNANLYAKQNNRHSFQLNSNELKKFIRIRILSGYYKLPKDNLYWYLDEDMSASFVSKVITWQKFHDIKNPPLGD